MRSSYTRPNGTVSDSLEPIPDTSTMSAPATINSRPVPSSYPGPAVRPTSGMACVCHYTILAVSLFELFAYFGFFAHTFVLGATSLISWLACIFSLTSIGCNFSLCCQISSAIARIIAFFLTIAATILGVQFLNCTIETDEWICDSGERNGGPYTAWTVAMVIISTVLFFTSINAGCHIYLAVWISRGCPGAPGAVQPESEMPSSYVVAPRPVSVVSIDNPVAPHPSAAYPQNDLFF